MLSILTTTSRIQWISTTYMLIIHHECIISMTVQGHPTLCNVMILTTMKWRLGIICKEIILHRTSEVNQTFLIFDAIVARLLLSSHSSTSSWLPVRSKDTILLGLEMLQIVYRICGSTIESSWVMRVMTTSLKEVKLLLIHIFL
jgi:hypothetical protein